MTHRTSTIPSVPTRTTVELPTTVGLDLSDQVSHFHVQSGGGETLSTGKVATRRAELSAFFERWKGCRLVIEAGGHSPWISRLGVECGLEVVVANPRRVELISKSDRKTDRSDAQLLAELGRTNKALLSPITHRSDRTQVDLCVLRARDELVRTRTALINHVRGVLKSNGHRAASSSAASFARRVSATLPEDLDKGLRPLLVVLQTLSIQIQNLDGQIGELCDEHYPVTQLLQQIPGVGPVVSLSFVLTLEDPRRFRSARDVGAYLGLVPRKQSSGTSDPQMHITKSGDRDMRRLLVLSANYVLGQFGPDSDLKRFGLRIAGPGTNKTARKRARVAVARKLSVLMHHLWRTGEAYDPLHATKRRGDAAIA